MAAAKRRAPAKPAGIIASIRRNIYANPVAWFATLAALVGGLYAAWPVIYEGEPILRFRMEDYVGGKIQPTDKTVNLLYLDALKKWLDDAQKDYAKTKSPSAQKDIDRFTRQIEVQQKKIGQKPKE